MLPPSLPPSLSFFLSIPGGQTTATSGIDCKHQATGQKTTKKTVTLLSEHFCVQICHLLICAFKFVMMSLGGVVGGGDSSFEIRDERMRRERREGRVTRT